MTSRMDLWQQFLKLQKEHEILKLPVQLGAVLNNCEYIIHKEFDKNSREKYHYKKRKHELTQQFRQAFKSMDIDEKLSYYFRYMKMIILDFNGQLKEPQPLAGLFSGEVYSRSVSLKMWNKKILRLDRFQCLLFAEKENKIKTFKLEDYILRKSKSTEYHSFVLVAINKNPHQNYRVVHFGFKKQSELKQWYEQLQTVYRFLQTKNVFKIMAQTPISVKKIANTQEKERRTSQLKIVNDLLSSSSDQEENSMMGSMLMQKTQNKKKAQQDCHRTQQLGHEKQKEEEREGPFDLTRQRQKTIIECLSYADKEQIEDIQEKDLSPEPSEQQQNIFHKIVPEYNLNDLGTLVNFQSVDCKQTVKIFSDLDDHLHLKFHLLIEQECSIERLTTIICSPELVKKVNPEIQEFVIKTLIRSQNSALCYMKLKPYNRLYRPRDFIFLRHTFKTRRYVSKKQYEEVEYVVDKTVQNINYPPFTTIVRGDILNIWRIKQEKNGLEVRGDIRVKNEGYLKQIQDINLTTKYLNGFNHINKIIRQLKDEGNVIKNLMPFADDWIIKIENYNNKVQEQNSQNKRVNRRNSRSDQSVTEKVMKKSKKEPEIIQLKQNNTDNSFRKQQSIQNSLNQTKNGSANKNHPISSNKTPYSKNKSSWHLSNQMPENEGEINLQQIQEQQKEVKTIIPEIQRQFDQKGFVIISPMFTITKYILQPLPNTPIKYLEKINDHPIWKGQWKHDDKLGAIIYINQKKIEDQKGVLKFILSKIGKNILSGKSVMNISLPVDIFSAQSNLQLLMFSLTYAPIKIEPSCHLDIFERLKKVIAFGISNSPLYLNMEKPFNPILGETFQCYINGCPGYAQQISHHPPIASLIFKGRGYQIVAQLQSKVELHMNSGCGINDGIFRIKYDDGIQICYITPGGEVSGLTYGDRKFNMVGKSYYWTEGKDSENESLFLELIFNPTQKGFFSVGKQEKPIDYFEGFVCKVKRDFIAQFKTKKKPPNEKQIISKLGKVHGIWNMKTMFQDQCILDIDKEYPAKLQYELNPLPSDANWREDISYRRVMQITKAQSQKERLQILQRKDRKLREKFTGKKH